MENKASRKISWAQASVFLTLLSFVIYPILAVRIMRIAVLPWTVAYLGLFPAIPAIITGRLAFGARKRTPNSPRAVRWTMIGVKLCWFQVGAILVIAKFIPFWEEAKFIAQKDYCANHLKQLGLTFQMCAHEDADGYLPELSSAPGNLMFGYNEPGMSIFNSDNLTDPTVLVCPASGPHSIPFFVKPVPNIVEPAKLINDSSYVYLGYAVTNEEELKNFAAAYRDRIALGQRFEGDLDVAPGHGSFGGDRLVRLRLDRQTNRPYPMNCNRPPSEIPVMWDRCAIPDSGQPADGFNHASPPGAFVLFLDLHVEFIKYPGKFPVTEEACRILEELHRLSTIASDKEVHSRSIVSVRPAMRCWNDLLPAMANSPHARSALIRFLRSEASPHSYYPTTNP